MIDQNPIVHPLPETPKKLPPAIILIGGVVIILVGIFSGYSVASKKSGGGATSGSESTSSKVVVGAKDTKTFRDSAEGKLEKGGIKGEGTHKLIRPGGESQTVYVVSSVVNLDDFVGKKVKISGETFAAKNAAWLMDVGRVEVLQ